MLNFLAVEDSLPDMVSTTNDVLAIAGISDLLTVLLGTVIGLFILFLFLKFLKK